MTVFTPVIVSAPPFEGRVNDFDVVLLDGRQLLVCTHEVSLRACTWDPASDHWTEYSLDDPYGDDGDGYTELTALCAAVIDDRVVIGGGGDHQGFAQWDLESGKVRLSAWEGGVASATTADVGGRPLFVVGNTSGTGIQLWDPSAAEPDDDSEDMGNKIEADSASEPSPYDLLVETEELRADSYAASAVAAGVLGDRAVAVGIGDGADDHVLVWDIAEEEPLTEFDEHEEDLHQFALAIVDGATRVVAAGDRSIVVGNPETGAWDEPFTGPPLLTTTGTGSGASDEGGGNIRCLAVGLANGRPVAVTGAEDGTLRAWDLSARRMIGEPFRGSDAEIRAIAVMELDGPPVVVTAGHDGEVRVWAFAA
ncbi:WD40 repeat protein [Promicromonospora sp. AC04]|uniref:hypothetical protein n=1 Tax=Promicromonospora sp. AC04 TaxID=2135723 RepID=UPI000D47477A|nr:hypothetical protein [Promicromonospora sp. AC04]PUB26182.1 WD40 repeat protein [Promicromonospora sp. AC04]